MLSENKTEVRAPKVRFWIYLVGILVIALVCWVNSFLIGFTHFILFPFGTSPGGGFEGTHSIYLMGVYFWPLVLSVLTTSLQISLKKF